ncbi:MAG: sigma-54 dependent transcriptional regulator [Candidatus Eisenbacteria bacterium]|nr:sigma-54 dependent transcriptional regulator [Candidatus Eisenbacteria bacterium]
MGIRYPDALMGDTIYVIDDEKELCLTLKKVLEAEGYQVHWTTDPEEFLPRLHDSRLSCILLDLKLGGKDGLVCLRKIHETDPHLPVVMITAYETVKTAVEAMKAGAFHYLSKPFDNEELKTLVGKAVELRHLCWELEDFRNRAANASDLEFTMGHSNAVQGLIRQCAAVARTDVNVLLTGESGTGKELIANSIHQLSARKDGPWVPVDCASIPESLIESELFGHEKGAFTGAHAAQKGKLEKADGGTLFLDEVSNIPFNVQAKLLRFLETHTFERLGGRQTVAISMRVVAATNRELPQLIKEERFRQDLFHRFNEFPLRLPPLRERVEDIPYLSLKFLNDFQEQVGKTFSGFSRQALEALQSYPWPGNVRELRNVVKRAMVVGSGTIEKADLPDEIRNPSASGTHQGVIVSIKPGLPLFQATREAVSMVEKELIRGALQRAEGRRGKAADLLGIDEKTLYNKLKEYKIYLWQLTG